jgi:ferredoxin
MLDVTVRGPAARFRIEISDDCIGSAQCVATLPEVFETGPDGVAVLRVTTVGAELLEQVEAAVAGCPVGAISVREA